MRVPPRQPGEHLQIIQSADAPARQDRSVHAAEQLGNAGGVRAVHGSIGFDAGDDERVDTPLGKRCQHIGETTAAALGPTAHLHLTAEHVEAHRHGHSHGVTDLVDELRTFDGRRAHDDAPDTGVEEPLGRRHLAHAATDLHGTRHGRGDRAYRVLVAGRAGTCRVEIHHVDPRRAGSFESAGHRDGIGPVDRLLVEVTTQETHTTAGPQIDRRKQLERHQIDSWLRVAAATKFASTASPQGPLFSGWNCVAHTAPCSTAATIVPP